MKITQKGYYWLCRITSSFLLILSVYIFYLVVSRWWAFLQHYLKIRGYPDSLQGPWLTMHIDAVIICFASLVIIGITSILGHKMAIDNNEVISMAIFQATIVITTITITALLILISLPKTSLNYLKQGLMYNILSGIN